MSDSPEKIEPYETPLTEPARNGCSCCPDKPIVARMDMYLAVGFGSVTVTKNGGCVYDENRWDSEKEDFPTLGKYELLAQAEPDADWRCAFYAPLYEAEYQRQGKEHWVLIRKGLGFA